MGGRACGHVCTDLDVGVEQRVEEVVALRAEGEEEVHLVARELLVGRGRCARLGRLDGGVFVQPARAAQVRDGKVLNRLAQVPHREELVRHEPDRLQTKNKESAPRSATQARARTAMAPRAWGRWQWRHGRGYRRAGGVVLDDALGEEAGEALVAARGVVHDERAQAGEPRLALQLVGVRAERGYLPERLVGDGGGVGEHVRHEAPVAAGHEAVDERLEDREVPEQRKRKVLE